MLSILFRFHDTDDNDDYAGLEESWAQSQLLVPAQPVEKASTVQ